MKKLSNKERINAFWDKVDKSGDCWEWTASLNSSGYANFAICRKKIAGHRFSWILHFGEIPKNVHVLHTCDNRSCVNPDHLFLGTNNDNILDKVKKGRSYRPSGEKNGNAVLTESEVLQIRSIGHGNKAELARRFGVGRTQIQRIIARETWGHI